MAFSLFILAGCQYFGANQSANNSQMKVLKFEIYKDGGTEEITTNKGIYCFDGRISSKTAGQLFDGYPKEDNSNLVQDSGLLEQEIIMALSGYKDERNKVFIDELIKSKQK